MIPYGAIKHFWQVTYMYQFFRHNFSYNGNRRGAIGKSSVWNKGLAVGQFYLRGSVVSLLPLSPNQHYSTHRQLAILAKTSSLFTSLWWFVLEGMFWTEEIPLLKILRDAFRRETTTKPSPSSDIFFKWRVRSKLRLLQKNMAQLILDFAGHLYVTPDSPVCHFQLHLLACFYVCSCSPRQGS